MSRTNFISIITHLNNELKLLWRRNHHDYHCFQVRNISVCVLRFYDKTKIIVSDKQLHCFELESTQCITPLCELIFLIFKLRGRMIKCTEFQQIFSLKRGDCCRGELSNITVMC